MHQFCTYERSIAILLLFSCSVRNSPLDFHCPQNLAAVAFAAGISPETLMVRMRFIAVGISLLLCSIARAQIPSDEAYKRLHERQQHAATRPATAPTSRPAAVDLPSRLVEFT